MSLFKVVAFGTFLLASCKSSSDKAESAASPEEQPPPSPAAEKIAPTGDAESSFCDEFLSASLIAEHCGEQADLQPYMRRDSRCGFKALAGGDNVAFSATFIKLTPESYDKERLHFPTEPAFDDKTGGGVLRFSVYPHAVSLLSSGPNALCNAEQLRALGEAVRAGLPTGEAAPEVAEVPSCDELLPAAEVQKVCGKAIAVKDSGMSDGKLNICNHSADGLIFLLTRHASPEVAQKGASVATGGTAVAGGEVHASEGSAGPKAVATVRNLLVELKSGKGGAPCDKGQLETLGKGVVSRLQ